MMSNGTSLALNSEQDLASIPMAGGSLCHRHTTGFGLPDRRMISAIPQRSAAAA
jgi:hypothetical protein